MESTVEITVGILLVKDVERLLKRIQGWANIKYTTAKGFLGTTFYITGESGFVKDLACRLEKAAS